MERDETVDVVAPPNLGGDASARPSALSLAHSLQVHPDLVGVLTWTPEDVDREVARIDCGGLAAPIETVGGKIVSLRSAICAGALTALGRPVLPFELPAPPANLVEHGWRSFPEQRTDEERAVAAVRGKEKYLAIGKAKMIDGGKLGAAIRKGLAKSPAPKSSGKVRTWRDDAADALGTKEYYVRELDYLAKHTPDMFEALAEYDDDGKHPLTKLGDARALARRFRTNSAEDVSLRAGTIAEWKRRGGAGAGVKITECFAWASRRFRRPLHSQHKVTGKDVVRGDGYTLYLGRMEAKGRYVDDNSVDILFADIVYGDVGMAREVAKLAVRVLSDGAYLVIVNGNSPAHPLLDAVAETDGLVERPQLYVQYLHAKGGLARMGVRHVDGCPYYLWSKGEVDHPVDHLHFVSDTAPGKIDKVKGGKNSEGVHHLWQKNPKVLAEIFSALTPHGSDDGKPCVLDPCCGWGTSGVACRQIGFEFIGFEPENDPDADGGPRFSVACEDVEHHERAWVRAVGKSKPARKSPK